MKTPDNTATIAGDAPKDEKPAEPAAGNLDFQHKRFGWTDRDNILQHET